jgi:hypothetical protein
VSAQKTEAAMQPGMGVEPVRFWEVLRDEREALGFARQESRTGADGGGDGEPEPRGWALVPGQLVDPPAFAGKLLAERSGRVAEFLVERVGRPVVEAVIASDGAAADVRRLVDALNQVLASPSFYSRARFCHVEMDEDLRALCPSGAEQRLERNRRLLEAAFPDDIRTIDGLRLRAVHDAIHGDAARGQPHLALCLSGGGIRSATFSLGAIQALARAGLLDGFHYLSTVSGGGYVGSWLSAWIQRDGLRHVVQALASRPTTPLQPAPRPVEWLRKYSNYLTPQVGVFSADTWALIGTYLRNLLVNWSVLLPLILAIVALPHLFREAIAWPAPAGLARVLLVAGGLLFVVAIAYGVVCRPGHREARRRSTWLPYLEGQGAFLVVCLVPMVVGAVCLSLAAAWNPGWRGVDGWTQWRWSVVLYVTLVHALGAVLAWAVLRTRPPLQEVLVVLVAGPVGGLLTWLVAARVVPAAIGAWGADAAEIYAWLAPGLVLALFLVGATLFVGLVSRCTNDDDREWWARMGGWILIALVVLVVFSFLVLRGEEEARRAWRLVLAAAGGLGGLAAWLASSARTPGRGDEGQSTGWMAWVMNRALLVAGTAFGVVLVIGLSAAVMPLVAQAEALWPFGRPLPRAGAVAIVAGLSALAALVLAFAIDLNRFSLHAMYRDRLIRAYLGASRARRSPDAFTGFDPADNVHLSALVRPRLLHVINVALNLVKGRNLAWQERKAASFTMTPLHAGSRHLGYRPMTCYGRQGGGLSLGSAMTISGAAASPNMGYHSSPAATFLMTLWNARLGWWLGNPGSPGYRRRDPPYARAYPKFALGPLLAELFGYTDDRRRYVYLSDGGHFDNLGLLEMVARRCHRIVVIDAGCDPECSLADLGSAVRKVAIDLGVPIDIDPIPTRRPPNGTRPEPARYCVTGTIRYSVVDGDAAVDGRLVYIKPSVSGQEPVDVVNYSRLSAAFPHESTTDQWFTESQFESYRRLGGHAVERILAGARARRGSNGQGPSLDIDDFFDAAAAHAGGLPLRPRAVAGPVAPQG